LTDCIFWISIYTLFIGIRASSVHLCGVLSALALEITHPWVA
jgi:hypothetical protein